MPTAVTGRFEEVVVRSMIWGIVSGIFGAFFVGFREALVSFGAGDTAVIPAAALAGSVGAAFYGSLRVALLGTLSGLAAGIAYFFITDTPEYGQLALISGVLGLGVGFIYGLLNPSVSGALMKALTGLTAGALAGSLLWLLIDLGFALGDPVVSGLLAPLTGVFYVIGIFQVVDRLECKLPLPLVGALVACVLSIIFAGSIWVVHNALLEAVDAATIQNQNGSLTAILGCVTCAIIGGAIAGGSFSLLGLPWLDPE